MTNEMTNEGGRYDIKTVGEIKFGKFENHFKTTDSITHRPTAPSAPIFENSGPQWFHLLIAAGATNKYVIQN